MAILRPSFLFTQLSYTIVTRDCELNQWQDALYFVLFNIRDSNFVFSKEGNKDINYSAQSFIICVVQQILLNQGR